jgi:hypothetical protein
VVDGEAVGAPHRLAGHAEAELDDAYAVAALRNIQADGAGGAVGVLQDGLTGVGEAVGIHEVDGQPDRDGAAGPVGGQPYAQREFTRRATEWQPVGGDVPPERGDEVRQRPVGEVGAQGGCGAACGVDAGDGHPALADVAVRVDDGGDRPCTGKRGIGGAPFGALKPFSGVDAQVRADLEDRLVVVAAVQYRERGAAERRDGEGQCHQQRGPGMPRGPPGDLPTAQGQDEPGAALRERVREPGGQRQRPQHEQRRGGGHGNGGEHQDRIDPATGDR